MELVGEAIAQTQAGIAFADEHGGGWCPLGVMLPAPWQVSPSRRVKRRPS